MQPKETRDTEPNTSAGTGTGIGLGLHRILAKVEQSVLSNDALRSEMKEVQRWKRDFLEEGEKKQSDTNLLGHTLNTASNAKEITTLDQALDILIADESAMLLIAAYIHDLGEIGSGDVTRRRKTAEDKQEERQHFHSHLKSRFPDLTAEEIPVVREIYDDIAWGLEKQELDGTHQLAEYFRMIEVVGYVEFATEVFREKPAGIDWDRIAQGILHFQGSEIQEGLQHSEGLATFWQRRAPALKEMFEHYRAMPEEDLRYPIEFSLWEGLLSKLS